MSGIEWQPCREGQYDRWIQEEVRQIQGQWGKVEIDLLQTPKILNIFLRNKQAESNEKRNKEVNITLNEQKRE